MTAFSLAVLKIISVLTAVVMMPLSLLTSGLDLINYPKQPESIKTNIAGFGAIFRSQGITADGESFYFSSKTTLIKTQDDYRTPLAVNLSAIPGELKEKYGIKHIGGISFYKGKIYAGMEDSKVWKYPIVGVFNAYTLEFEDYFILGETEITEDGEKLVVSRGLPWVAVDGESGLLYCTDHSKKPKRLLAFDVNDGMKKKAVINLSESVPSIQGGEIFNGILYAATNDDTASVYKIDIQSGKAEKLFDRNLLGGEGEGLTLKIVDGKPVIFALDMGTIFVNCFVREYEAIK